VLKKVAAFLRGDLGEERSNFAVEARDCALGRLAQQRFEFAEDLLDRIELRRILRQVHEFRPNRLNRFLDAADLVGREVVHNDDIAARESWRQTLFDICNEGRSVHRPINHQRSHRPIMAHTGHQCDCLPIPVRHAADQSLAAWTASPEPNHMGADAGFIEEDQRGRIQKALLPDPAPASAGHVLSLLFRRAQAFF